MLIRKEYVNNKNRELFYWYLHSLGLIIIIQITKTNINMTVYKMTTCHFLDNKINPTSNKWLQNLFFIYYFLCPMVEFLSHQMVLVSIIVEF